MCECEFLGDAREPACTLCCGKPGDSTSSQKPRVSVSVSLLEGPRRRCRNVALVNMFPGPKGAFSNLSINIC